jgi:PAS domain S-box-containing protein
MHLAKRVRDTHLSTGASRTRSAAGSGARAPAAAVWQKVCTTRPYAPGAGARIPAFPAPESTHMTPDVLSPLDDTLRPEVRDRTAQPDGRADVSFDRLTRLVCRVLGVPAAFITAPEGDRLAVLGKCGLPPAEDGQLTFSPDDFPRLRAAGEPLLVPDVREDPALRDASVIADLGAVAYVAVPLLGGDGEVLGTLRAIDRRPRPWTEEEVETLGDLAAAVTTEMELRAAAREHLARTEQELQQRELQLEEALQIARLGRWEWDVAGDRVQWSDELYRIYGLEPRSVRITLDGFLDRIHPDDRENTRTQVERALHSGESFAFEERILRPDGEVRLLRSRGEVIRDEEGRTVRLIGTCLDITEQKAAAERAIELAQEQAARAQAEAEERRSRFLASASSVLSASLDYKTTLDNLAHLVVPELADWCAIDVLGDDGVPHRVVTAHWDPERERLAAELEARYPADPDAPTGVRQVVRTGEAELTPEIPDEMLVVGARDEEHLRILRELRLRSAMVVPLTARGRTLGAITFVAAESDRRYGQADLALAEELAHRAALAVDNAGLFRAAERASQQTTRILESITDAFFALGTDWRFAYLNDEAENLLQRSREELLGTHIWEEFPAAVGSTFQGEYERAVRERHTVQFTEFYPPLDSWFEVRAYPSPDGLSVYFRNVNDRIAAEEALRRSEERFRAVQETSPDGFMVFESIRGADGAIEDFRWVYMNPAAEQIVGRDAADLLGERLLVEMPGNREDGLFDDYVRVVETGERSTRVFHYVHEGMDHWFRNTAVRVGDGFAVAFADISSEKRAELELEQQSELLKTISDNATAALFMMNAQGRCTFMNPAAEAMIGFSLDEIRDMPLHDAIHHHHPDGRPYPIAECPIDRALPEDSSVRAHEDVFIRKNGDMFPVVCAAAPIFDDEGKPVGTVVEVRDVTAEKESQLAVRVSEQRYRSLVEATAAIVWNTPASGEFGGEQPGWSAFTGQSPSEYENLGWLDRIHPDDREPTVQAWRGALAERALYEVEHRVCRHDGEFRHMQARAVPIVDADGTIREWVGIHTDITERKSMEERQRFLVEVGALLSSSLDYEVTLASVAQLAVPGLADWCAVDLIDAEGRVRRVEVAHTDPDKRRLAWELEERYPPDPDAPAGVPNVLRTGEPEMVQEIPDEFLEMTAQDAEHLQIVRDLGLKSYIVVPLIARGRIMGAITLVNAESGRRFTADDLEMAQELALRSAFAVDNARLVTELHRTLTDLRTSEQSYRFLAESIPQLVWTARADGYHDYFNERWYEYTGMPRSGQAGGEGIGPPAAPQGWNWKEYLHPDDYERAVEVWDQSLRTGDAYGVEYRLRRAADGEFRWFLGRALPLRDDAGEIVKWFGTCTEIHDQKEAEADRDRLIDELDTERARLANIFMEAPAFIATLRGPEHRFEMANPPYYQMVGEREMIGRTIREALPEIEGQGFFELLDEVYRSGEPFVGSEAPVVVRPRPDAQPEERFVNFVYQPVRGAGGEITGIFVHGVDVTGQVRARQEVEAKAEELRPWPARWSGATRSWTSSPTSPRTTSRRRCAGSPTSSQWIEEDLPGEIPDEASRAPGAARGGSTAWRG